MTPDGWRAMRFVDVADYHAGRTPARARSDYWDKTGGGVPWVAISDMTEFGTVMKPSERITQVAFQQVFQGKTVPAGTLVMSYKLTVGRVAVLGIDACHNEAIIAIRPREGVDQRFLGYFLAQVDYTALQDRQVKGNTLNRDKLDRIEILVPTLEDQRRVADVLDAVRNAIRVEETALETSKELKRATMRDVFTRGLRGRPLKESEIGPVPNDWNVAPLGAVARIGNGTTPNRTNTAYWDGGTVPWVTSGRMYERRISQADIRVTSVALDENSLPLLQPGTVLIAIVGQGKTLGHCAILDVEATISRHVGFIETRPEVIVPEFLVGYLESQYQELRQLASGHGSTRGALTCAMLRRFQVPIAPIDEQHEIAAAIAAIDRKIDIHRRKSAVLDELFKVLLHKLMTGEISVADLDLTALEPASEPESLLGDLRETGTTNRAPLAVRFTN